MFFVDLLWSVIEPALGLKRIADLLDTKTVHTRASHMPTSLHHTPVTTWAMYAMYGWLREAAIRQSVGVLRVFQWDLWWLNVVALSKKFPQPTHLHMDIKLDAEAAIADYVRRLWSNFGGVNGAI